MKDAPIHKSGQTATTYSLQLLVQDSLYRCMKKKTVEAAAFPEVVDCVATGEEPATLFNLGTFECGYTFAKFPAPSQ